VRGLLPTENKRDGIANIVSTIMLAIVVMVKHNEQ